MSAGSSFKSRYFVVLDLIRLPTYRNACRSPSITSLPIITTDIGDLDRFNELWTPELSVPPSAIIQASSGAPGAVAGTGYDDHKPRTPPPDLPSLLLDSRIVYLGMPLVPAVTELIIAELLYLQYKDRTKPVYLYINSTGTTRADGETVGFETEGTAIYDTISFIKNDVHTVGVGVAIGQSCMLLSAGAKGKRYMLEHATAMLHQPRVPPTGQRQAVEVQIKWKEVLAQKQNMLTILSRTTGHSPEKLDKDMQRPLYMQPKDAIDYGVCDGVVTPQKKIIDDVKSAGQWDKEAGLVAR
jgi:ATP-dependent Clp endopeptidase proteolytic subunit ClpP